MSTLPEKISPGQEQIGAHEPHRVVMRAQAMGELLRQEQQGGSIALRRDMQAASHDGHAHIPGRDQRFAHWRRENHLLPVVESGAAQLVQNFCCRFSDRLRRSGCSCPRSHREARRSANRLVVRRAAGAARSSTAVALLRRRQTAHSQPRSAHPARAAS